MQLFSFARFNLLLIITKWPVIRHDWFAYQTKPQYLYIIMKNTGRVYLSYFLKYKALVYGILKGTPCIFLLTLIMTSNITTTLSLVYDSNIHSLPLIIITASLSKNVLYNSQSSKPNDNKITHKSAKFVNTRNVLVVSLNKW